MGTPIGEDVLIVANSIDINLVEDFLDFLRKNNIDATIVNASEFTEAKKVENRQIIILGGPDAPEGIGEIVRDLLTPDEVVEVRQPGSEEYYIKINVWTGRYVYKQRVLIVAGSDRNYTRGAVETYSELLKTQIFLS